MGAWRLIIGQSSMFLWLTIVPLIAALSAPSSSRPAASKVALSLSLSLSHSFSFFFSSIIDFFLFYSGCQCIVVVDVACDVHLFSTMFTLLSVSVCSLFVLFSVNFFFNEN